MLVHHLQCLSGASKAKGATVVIDVFRASSNIVTMLARGAETIVPVAKVEQARLLKKAHPDWLLAGEREGLPLEGFDFGNSPYEASKVDFTGKTVILTTSAGSKGLVESSVTGDPVLVGCFLNASAVCRYINNHPHEEVSFVALGVCGEIPSPEDNLAAEYMEMLLARMHMDFDRIKDEIRAHPEGQKFLDPENKNYMPEDFEECLRVDVYDIVPVLGADGMIHTHREKTGLDILDI
ncbi:MAG: 2-phosphosulfolactate phosphatase [Planctomycetes bacterium]|nr:2-phosphosulfolactate phosphatase [Planctomycetota bacterium]